MTGPRVHPTALVESDQVGNGTLIWAFVHVMAGAVVGEECKLGDHVFVETGAVVGDRVTIKNNSLIWHGVSIGDDAFIGPNVVFTNDMYPRAHRPSGPDDWISTQIGEGTSIGANATVVCGVNIGPHAMVGAGSVVIRDVKAHELVAGNPARHRGWVCYCGSPMGEDLRCEVCGRSYVESQSGLTEAAG